MTFILLGTIAWIALVRRAYLVVLLLFTSTLPVITGLVLMHDSSALSAYGAGAVAVLGAMTIIARDSRRRERIHVGDRLRLRPGQKALVTGAGVIASVGTLLYFISAGIPLLSGNVEVARFNFAASSLLGVPGRLSLYGLPLATALFIRANYLEGLSPLGSRQSKFIFAVYCLSRILSGFKSGLLDVAVTFGVIYIAAGYRVRSRHLTRAILIMSVAIASAFVIGSHYATYARSGTFAALRDRATIQAAQAPASVLDSRSTRAFGDAPLRSDWSFYLHKYFRLGSAAPQYSFQDKVSSQLYGTPLESSSFLVPVTTTAVADQIYDFGVIYGCLALAFTGLVLQEVLNRSPTTSSLIRWGACVATVLGGYSYLTKGDLVYAVINWSVVLCILAVGGAIIGVFLGKRTGSRLGNGRRPEIIADARGLRSEATV